VHGGNLFLGAGASEAGERRKARVNRGTRTGAARGAAGHGQRHPIQPQLRRFPLLQFPASRPPHPGELQVAGSATRSACASFRDHPRFAAFSCFAGAGTQKKISAMHR